MSSAATTSEYSNCFFCKLSNGDSAVNEALYQTIITKVQMRINQAINHIIQHV